MAIATHPSVEALKDHRRWQCGDSGVTNAFHCRCSIESLVVVLIQKRVNAGIEVRA